MMQVSAEGRTFIEGFEGYRDVAYRCPAGVLTIGYGHTAGVKEGQRLSSKEEGDALLSGDLLSFGGDVERLVDRANTTQHQFDALVSLAENIGTGNFSGSTVLRMHKAGRYPEAGRAFSMWNEAVVDGRQQPVAGLTRRRAAEGAVYLTPEDAPHPMPAPVVVEAMPQAVAAPQSAAKSKTLLAAAGIGVSGAGVVSDNVNQVNDLMSAVSSAGGTAASIWSKLGHAAPAILGVIIVIGAIYLGVRYFGKIRSGAAVSV